MLRWAVHLEGGPRRVNHAAVAVGHKVYSFGGYCSGEDYETLRQIDVHVFNVVSLRWIKLPPVWTNSRDHVREVPYMRLSVKEISERSSTHSCIQGHTRLGLFLALTLEKKEAFLAADAHISILSGQINLPKLAMNIPGRIPDIIRASPGLGMSR
ncbi:Klhdc3 [Columba livia]|nr:Klhdc3 [Columba livia]